MNRYRLIFFIVFLVSTIICYFASENLYITIGVGIIFLIYPQIFFVKKLENNKKTYDRFHECFHFVNTFIVSLDIRGSLNATFNAVNATMSQSYQTIFNGLSLSKSEDKITYLQKYFPFHFYGLFINIVTLWQEEGGDILSMSRHLLEEGRKSEDYLRYCYDINLHRTIEFAVLWMFSLLILVVMRVSLNQFFNHIVDKITYQVGLSLFFLFLLLSIDILVRKITTREVKGWEGYE